MKAPRPRKRGPGRRGTGFQSLALLTLDPEATTPPLLDTALCSGVAQGLPSVGSQWISKIVMF